MRTRFEVIAACMAVFLSSAGAYANGRFPAANMLVARPGDPSRLVLRATYGILLSSDGGATWDWMCERAVGYIGNEDPTVAITGSGATLVAMFGGFARSTDGGCAWQRDPKGPESVVDMAIRPSKPNSVYAVSSHFAKVGDAGTSLFHSEVLVSDDAGAHWTTRAVLDPSLLVDSVEVAPSDPERIYVSAIRPRGKDTRAVLLVSSDDGARFKEHEVPFETTDRGVYIAAVDPNRADRVYLRTTGVDASRVVVTDDGGKTTRTAFDGGQLLGFALADDGATVYAGGPKEGLLVASATDLRFTKRSPLPVQCLTTIGATLWACAPTRSGFVLAASANGGATFSPKLTLAGMRGPLRCDPATAGKTCAADWASFQALVSSDDANNAKDAGPPPKAAPDAPASRACGCTTPGTGARIDSHVMWTVSLAFAWLLVRRRSTPAAKTLRGSSH